MKSSREERKERRQKKREARKKKKFAKWTGLTTGSPVVQAAYKSYKK